jgi:dipeptidase D
MLYLAETADVARGPLDLIFTVLEETTSGGADALDPALVRSRVLLNLDSEEDGVVVVGSAGGIWTVLRWSAPMARAPAGWAAIEIAVSGLLGGHSGTDINKHRLNAIQGLLRLLQAVAGDGPFSIRALEGGDAFNAIPRQARAVVYVPEEASARRALSDARDELARECLRSEPGLTVRIDTPAANPPSAFLPADSQRLLDMLRVVPCGVLAMDQQIPGLVETSNNLGVLTMEGATASIECFTRSSVTPAMHAVVDMIEAAARLGGADLTIVPPEGPCWEVDPSSGLLAEARAAYRRLFGEDPRLLAVHGFLECALIKKQVPDLDVVSIGPEICDAHKPGERVHIESVDRFLRLVSELLRALASGASSPIRAPNQGGEVRPHASFSRRRHMPQGY